MGVKCRVRLVGGQGTKDTREVTHKASLISTNMATLRSTHRVIVTHRFTHRVTNRVTHRATIRVTHREGSLMVRAEQSPASSTTTLYRRNS